MSKRLKLYITGVVATSAVALVVTALVFPVDPLIDLAPDLLGSTRMVAGLAFWCFLTLVASALPVRMPRGTLVGVSGAPIIAAAFLGGPTAAGLGRADRNDGGSRAPRTHSLGTARWRTTPDW